jgi:hypothetical protein
MRSNNDQITKRARVLDMFNRVNAKLRARKAGLRVLNINGALVARGRDGKFQSLLNFN